MRSLLAPVSCACALALACAGDRTELEEVESSPEPSPAAASPAGTSLPEPGAALPGAALPGAASPSPPPPAVVLGTGSRAFEPLLDGAHATLIAGPQGAYHVWTSFLSYGYDSDVLRMDISTGWDDAPETRFDMHGEVVARATLDAEGLSARETRGWPAVVREPLCEDGRALRVNLTVTDAAGNAASDTRRWILDVAEQYRPADCPSSLAR